MGDRIEKNKKQNLSDTFVLKKQLFFACFDTFYKIIEIIMTARLMVVKLPA